MPSDFNVAIKVVLANEGGLVDSPADPGGLTNFGISQRAHPNVDIRHLTADSAAEIYRHEYWLYGDLNSQDVATKLLDMSVNMGPKRAITLVQISLNDIGEHCGVDGKWGPATESTINGSDAVVLLPEIRASQSHYYTNLVARDPSLYQFLKGWLRRVQSC
jgi:lysozyme family protein